MSDVIPHVLDQKVNERLRAGEVVEITESDMIIVTLDGDETSVRCDLLATSEGAPPVMVAGDRVLLWLPPDKATPVVIGRIGPTRGVIPESPIPETLTLQATHALTLRVGDGSITIHQDGKILIKGKDLVSHAQRMVRIKGGAVSIN